MQRSAAIHVSAGKQRQIRSSYHHCAFILAWLYISQCFIDMDFLNGSDLEIQSEAASIRNLSALNFPKNAA